VVKCEGVQREDAWRVSGHASFVRGDESFVGLDESFVRLNESFVGEDESFVRLNESFVGEDESFVRLDESFVGLNESFVGLNESFVRLNESFVLRFIRTCRHDCTRIRAGSALALHRGDGRVDRGRGCGAGGWREWRTVMG
jgi:hypothetical protein